MATDIIIYESGLVGSNPLYIEVYKWILKYMYGASQDFGCRVCS